MWMVPTTLGEMVVEYREVTNAQVAEKGGIVSRLVPPAELMKTAESIAGSIVGNHEDMVLMYKAVINDGMKLALGNALELEKKLAHSYYEGMHPEMFIKMQKTRPPSRL